MSQQVQELIDKIKSEGVQAAEKKAKEIEDQARQQAHKIIQDAQKQTERMKTEAKEDIKRLQESTTMALKQAGRDTLLSVRKDIDRLLKRLISQEIGDVLKPEQFAHILAEAVEGAKAGEDVVVALNPKDLEKLKDGFTAKLQREVKGKIHFHAADDIGSGFTISYDGGKSSFDFSDESLANYLSSFLSSQIAELLK